MHKDHIPVMLQQVLEILSPKKDDVFLDCTFGAGGYSYRLLKNCNCSVYAIDRDPDVQYYSSEIQKEFPNNFIFKNCDFTSIKNHFNNIKFQGIVADLGVSSMQLDNLERGFSFNSTDSLDMRMSKSGLSAADFINKADISEIADVIYTYGEETAARAIARAIEVERKLSPIITCVRLADIVRKVKSWPRGKIDPATKTFQAIRIYINDELNQLTHLLKDSLDLLENSGKLIVVSFHSLEDAIVKKFFNDHSIKKVATSKYAKKQNEIYTDKHTVQVITKKPLTPQIDEVYSNHRARSAKLRACIKIN